MEQNTDRLGFALLALSVFSLVLFVINSSVVNIPSAIMTSFQTTMGQSPNSKKSSGNPDQTPTKYYDHYAWSASADGKNMVTTKPSTELQYVGRYSDKSLSGSKDPNDYQWDTNPNYKK